MFPVYHPDQIGKPQKQWSQTTSPQNFNRQNQPALRCHFGHRTVISVLTEGNWRKTARTNSMIEGSTWRFPLHISKMFKTTIWGCLTWQLIGIVALKNINYPHDRCMEVYLFSVGHNLDVISDSYNCDNTSQFLSRSSNPRSIVEVSGGKLPQPKNQIQHYATAYRCTTATPTNPSHDDDILKSAENTELKPWETWGTWCSISRNNTWASWAKTRTILKNWEISPDARHQRCGIIANVFFWSLSWRCVNKLILDGRLR